jgi:DNA-binding transcriptional ArsR family regulator
MDTRRDVFQALADPTRRQIIRLIAAQPHNLNTIAENFNMTRQGISLHMKVLTECGVVAVQRKGRERYCSIQPQRLAEAADWLEPFRKMWEDKHDRLEDIIHKLKSDKNDT